INIKIEINGHCQLTTKIKTPPQLLITVTFQISQRPNSAGDDTGHDNPPDQDAYRHDKDQVGDTVTKKLWNSQPQDHQGKKCEEKKAGKPNGIGNLAQRYQPRRDPPIGKLFMIHNRRLICWLQVYCTLMTSCWYRIAALSVGHRVYWMGCAGWCR